MILTTGTKLLLTAVLLSVMALFTRCSEDENTPGGSKVRLSITDAPIDNEGITGVFITILRIEMNGPDGWETFGDYPEGMQLNLLDYQNGKSHFLEEKAMMAGTYKEVRLILDIAEHSENGQKSNPGCYLAYEDGSIQPLFVPSGAQTGYKAKGSFTLPVDGVVNVTLDFDVRKAVIKAGNSGKFLLKPTIRLVANEDAGMIKGVLTDTADYDKIVVYAYKDGIFTEEEALENEEGIAFAEAVTSGNLSAEGDFTLAFMKSDTYDLFFVAYDTEGKMVKVFGRVEDVALEGGEIISLELSPGDLAPV